MVKRRSTLPSLLAESGVRTPFEWPTLMDIVQRSAFSTELLLLGRRIEHNNLIISKHALMVKRLRRRPLTAESGVRFSLGVPNKKDRFLPIFFILYLNRKSTLVRSSYDGQSMMDKTIVA